jgi:hypothetical protein
LAAPPFVCLAHGVCYATGMTDRRGTSIDEGESRRRFSTPGLLLIVFGLLFICVIGAGILINREVGGIGGPRRVTVADLLGDPDRWDNREVELTGTAENVRTLPVLSQYALYTFRDETGSLLVLTQKGAPPADGRTVRLRGLYHSRVTLDDELRRIIEDQLGSVAAAIVSTLVPGIPLNVVFLEHESYELLAPPASPTN